MTAPTADRPGQGADHVVQLYAADAELVDVAGERLLEALAAGSQTIVIATEQHRRAFEGRLVARGIDVEAARDGGRLTMIDASELLARHTGDGAVDVAAIVAGFRSQLLGPGRTGRPVWIFGEMVAILWEAGDVVTAMELEARWDELSRDAGCSIFCAYPSATVSGPEHGEALVRMCGLHSHLVPREPGSASWDFEPRATAAAEARDRLTELLHRAGHDGELLDDARVVLTELVANAVVHARSRFTVRVAVDDSLIRIEVRDPSPLMPEPRGSDRTAPDGRGLRLVGALARRWGVGPAPEGKLVWAELEP